MQGSPASGHSLQQFVLGSLLFLWTGFHAWGQEARPAVLPEHPGKPHPPVLVVDLPTCRQMALEKQPALAAYRASLAAAQAKVVALDNLGKLASLVRKDLCVRQQQAALGVAAAEARLHQGEWDTLYAVTRLYWSAVYAQSQVRRADRLLVNDKKAAGSLYRLMDILIRVRKAHNVADKWLDQTMETTILMVRARREEARFGGERALAALREAIGLEPGCLLAVKDQELPLPRAGATREQIIKLALARRGEIVQAHILVEVAGLEVKAQALNTHQLKVETFAAGSDLHAQSVPAPSFGDEYQPGAVGVEVPVNLAGPACLRVEQAEAIRARIAAVLDKTCGLIALEAESVFLKWLEAQSKYDLEAKAADSSDKITEEIVRVWLEQTPDSRATVADIQASIFRQSITRLQASQTHLQLVISLAGLERVTAGGFCPVFIPPLEGINPDKTETTIEKREKKADK